MEINNYIDNIIEKGTLAVIDDALNNLQSEWSILHKSGYIHIHNLESYSISYNNLILSLVDNFPYHIFHTYSKTRKIISIFEYIKDITNKILHEISDGVSFANFDDDIATILTRLNITNLKQEQELISECVCEFLIWCNENTIINKTYDITLNIGLSINPIGQNIAKTLLTETLNNNFGIKKTNIVFKVKNGINKNKEDANYNIYRLANKATLSTSSPYYLLCDTEFNSQIEPKEISIVNKTMKISDNIFTKKSSIGRGNLIYTTINMPRIAFEIEEYNDKLDIENKINAFKAKWQNMVESVKDISINGYDKLVAKLPKNLPNTSAHNLWKELFYENEDIESILKHGTIAIGFVGFYDAIEILTKKDMYKDNDTLKIALDLIKFMKELVDQLSKEYIINFVLIPTENNEISKRFFHLDNQIFKNKLSNKKYYKNDFNSKTEKNIENKLLKESIFYKYLNAGFITSIEIEKYNINKIENIQSIIDKATSNDIDLLEFISSPKNIDNKLDENDIVDDFQKTNNEEDNINSIFK